MHGTVVSADTRGGAGREISAMAWRPYHFTAADMGGWSLSRSATEHQLIGILTARNAPDFSVDADRYQEPAASPAKSGHLDRLAGHLDRFDPLAGLGNRRQWFWAPGVRIRSFSDARPIGPRYG
jgi:hypothetical protein